MAAATAIMSIPVANTSTPELLPMKRFLVTFVTLTSVLALSLSAQTPSPTIVFDSLSKDFGKAVEGEKLKHVFKFTNKGQGTLEILSAEST
jgi:hypothetical protein